MKLLFVCHGNICRSPMAEFVMLDLIRREGGPQFCVGSTSEPAMPEGNSPNLPQPLIVHSAALHTDEIGSDIHHGTRRILEREGIPFTSRQAWLLTAAKAREYDLIIGMDAYNMADLRHLVYPEDQPKLHLLLSFAGLEDPIADPWYTGNFDETYHDISLGCSALLRHLKTLQAIQL